MKLAERKKATKTKQFYEVHAKMRTHKHTFGFKSAMKVFHTFKCFTFQSSNDKWPQCVLHSHSSRLSHSVAYDFATAKENTCQLLECDPLNMDII